MVLFLCVVWVFFVGSILVAVSANFLIAWLLFSLFEAIESHILIFFFKFTLINNTKSNFRGLLSHEVPRLPKL